MNGASLLASFQVLVKACKEAITAVINILSIFFPAMAAETFILKVRGVCNKIDEVIEKAKVWLLAVVKV
jgi:hypothetical protein